MKSSKPAVVGVVMSLAALIGLAGCDRSMESAKNDMAAGAQTAENKTDTAVDNMQQKAKRAEGTVSDATITTKVKSAILNDPDLKVLQIHVDTVGGVVTLTGTVDSPQISEHANTVVSNVDGVKSVDNKLQIKAAG